MGMRMELKVSSGTLKNWERLSTKSDGRLSSRANKTNSNKRFVPVEKCSKHVEKWVLSLIHSVLVCQYDIESVLYSIIMKLFKIHGVGSKGIYGRFCREYSEIELVDDIFRLNIPNDFDIIGTIYQAYLTEGEKNINGSYYTPASVANCMLSRRSLSSEEKFLDPCCGSGTFLLLNDVHPSQLYGIDNDRIAVMLSKANLILKYKEFNFYPQVYHVDFLNDDIGVFNALEENRFDFIATNPPWGGKSCDSIYKDRASAFFVKACQFLKRGGEIDFLMPISVLNVKAHTNFRKYILNSGKVNRIVIYDKLFSGVATQCVSISFQLGGGGCRETVYECDGICKKIDLVNLIDKESSVFNFIDDIDKNIILKIRSCGELTLENSKWALGIVTGDNKNKIKKNKSCGDELIYTGKDIQPYCLKPAQNYIYFDRSKLQQVAKDEYYRAPEKLVYKFISRKLVFAYDNTGALFLNSANILIPNIHGMSIKTVMVFLNSKIFQYLYIKLFNELKILKGNLMKMPFPILTKEQNAVLDQYASLILSGDVEKKAVIEDWLQDFYKLDDKEMKHIKGVVDGRID